MAPEVHAGKTDFRSDIFSFGATLFFLATAREAVALTTENLQSVRSPSAWVAGIAENVAKVILKCLARDPNERYKSTIEAMKSFSEWPIEPAEYQRCPKHDFEFYADRGDAICPFCGYEADFERRTQYVAHLLEQL